MRILINAASANMGGAYTYLQNLLRWIPQIAPEDEFVVYLPRETRANFGHVTDVHNVHLETYPFDNTSIWLRIVFDQVVIPRLVRKHKSDILFSSTGFGTFVSPCPQILLVRNPVYFSRDFHEKYRELGRSLKRNSLRRRLSTWSIRYADFVLFPTQAMQDMVAEFVNLDAKDTRAIHYGFDHDVFSGNGETLQSFLSDVKLWREQGFRVILNVSTYAVHKNFETLIESLPILRSKGLRVKLVTTTSRDKTTDKNEYDTLVRRAQDLGVDGDWIELGYVPYTDLQTLYQSSDLFVFPSFTESFGHSLVEAAALGLPTVAADMPVNREVCGKGGHYFSKFEPEACADAIARLLTDEEYNKEISSQALERAKHFSWRRYTEEIVNLFHDESGIS